MCIRDRYKPKKFLYLVHREQIAKKALESFYRVIGGKKSDYGLLTGNKHDFDKKYLFGTVQTVSQEQIPVSYTHLDDTLAIAIHKYNS